MQIHNLQSHEDGPGGRPFWTAEIHNYDTIHYVNCKWGSWEEIQADGRRRFLHYEHASKLQREVKQRIKRERM